MKKNRLSFSIVTPSFNQARYIQHTIKSVLSQEYSNFSYVIQDGGSTDGTKKILASHANRLSYESKKDAGQTDAINKGLQKSTGDIFAYINSDDYYLPKVFSKVASLFSIHPEIMWLVGDAIIVDKDGKEIQSIVRGYKKCWRDVYSSTVLQILNPIPQPSVFVRRSAIDELGPFDESLHYTMDYDMWQRLQRRFGSPHFVHEPLSAFRIHGDSKGGSQYSKQFAEEEHVLARYTKNPILLWLHRLHNRCILAAYSILK